MSQVEIKTELGTNTLTGHNETNRKRQLETMFSEKVFEQQKDALTIHNGIIFKGVIPFIPPKLRHLVLAKAHETSWEECN